MASIINIKKRWRALIRRKGFKPLCKTFDSRQEAESWAAAVEGTMSGIGTSTDPDNIHIKALLSTTFGPVTLDQVIDCSVPVSQVSGVYFLLNDDQLTYIGSSVDVARRLIEHRVAGKKFNRFAVLPCPLHEARKAELDYIKVFKPRENIRGTVTS